MLKTGLLRPAALRIRYPPLVNTSQTRAASMSQTAKAQKLHGRAFYESIGSPKLILAPMVEQSEFVRREFEGANTNFRH